MVPLFYAENLDGLHQQLFLDDTTSRHIVQVLRMRMGEQLELTDGRGNLVMAHIIDDNKKKVAVDIVQVNFLEKDKKEITIGVSLVKNVNRFEWMLEKATEIGVHCIIPLICDRTERQHIRIDRMKNILISAMLQSRQCWLPELREPQPFDLAIKNVYQEQKFIAHCIDATQQELAALVKNFSSAICLIGPEGDFTPEEISLAVEHDFIPTALGKNRLRTETAAIVAATLLKLSDQK